MFEKKNVKYYMDNYYELLNIKSDATQEEIKRAYQNLILKCHPDKTASNSNTPLEQQGTQELFLKAQCAKETLFDVEKRKQYDRRLKESCLNQVKGPLFSSETLEALDYDEVEECYYFDCRCGGCYVLDSSEVDNDKDCLYIQCDDCTFYVEIKLKGSNEK